VGVALPASGIRLVDSRANEISEHVLPAAKTLTNILESAREVERMIQRIASAANEQTSAAGEISESAAHISQLATENSHASEQTTDGCKQLSVLANDLDGIIRQFRLSEQISLAWRVSASVSGHSKPFPNASTCPSKGPYCSLLTRCAVLASGCGELL
jgi:hypothetical protein